MNFFKGHITRGAVICLLGWGIFLAPIKGWGYSHLGDNKPPDQLRNKKFEDNTPEVNLGNAESDLKLYETLDKQLGENRKEFDKLRTWQAGPLTEKVSEEKKKELEEEKKTILEESNKILERLVAYDKALGELEGKIAPESLAYFNKLKAHLEERKKEHKSEWEIAKTKLEIEELEKKKRTPKEQKEYEKKVTDLKDSIMNYIESDHTSISNQFAEKLRQTLEELERHEQQFKIIEDAKPKQEQYTPYQSSYKPLVTEDNPHLISEPKPENEKAPEVVEKESPKSETNSTGSGSGSSAIGPSSTATQSRGSASESNANHSTEENGSPTLAVPKNTAETVPDNHDNRAYANSFGDQQGISPQNSTNPGNANLNPTGAGAVATPMSNSVVQNAGQPASPIKPSATAGTTNYTIYNNGDSKQGASPNAGATSPAVSEQQAGPAPLEVKNDLSGSRPLAKLTNGKTGRVNVAYNTTNAGTTNIPIQQNYETPVANYEPKPDYKVQAYSLDKNGNLVATESTAGAKRDVASSGNYEDSATAIDTDLKLKKLESEIADNISELKVNPTNENSKIKNETKVEPTLSTIDKFIAGINDYLPSGKGILGDIPSGGTESGSKNHDVTETKSKPTNLLAGKKASAAEPPNWLNTIKTFWNGLWN